MQLTIGKYFSLSNNCSLIHKVIFNLISIPFFLLYIDDRAKLDRKKSPHRQPFVEEMIFEIIFEMMFDPDFKLMSSRVNPELHSDFSEPRALFVNCVLPNMTVKHIKDKR